MTEKVFYEKLRQLSTLDSWTTRNTFISAFDKLLVELMGKEIEFINILKYKFKVKYDYYKQKSYVSDDEEVIRQRVQEFREEFDINKLIRR